MGAVDGAKYGADVSDRLREEESHTTKFNTPPKNNQGEPNY